MNIQETLFILRRQLLFKHDTFSTKHSNQNYACADRSFTKGNATLLIMRMASVWRAQLMQLAHTIHEKVNVSYILLTCQRHTLSSELHTSMIDGASPSSFAAFSIP